jgi:hypothetical protein
MEPVLPKIKTNIFDCRKWERSLRGMRVRETLHTIGRGVLLMKGKWGKRIICRAEPTVY